MAHTNPTPRSRILLAVATALVLVIPALPGAADEPEAEFTPAAPSGLQPRRIPAKPIIFELPPGASTDALHLKLHEGSTARLRNGTLTGAASEHLDSVNGVLAALPGATVSRMFERSEAVLAAEKAALEARSGRQQADKNLWFWVDLAPGTDTVAAINALNALPIVETAYAAPLPAPLPATPDFTGFQGYDDAAPAGIDVSAAAALPGGTGGNVTIIDVEYSWNSAHEDLTAAASGLIPMGTPCDPFGDDNHGTAVLGELIATSNGFGVTGLVPDAGIGMVNAARFSGGCSFNQNDYRLDLAIDIATANLVAGDVILIEQQAVGPESVCTGEGGSQEGLIAVEWVQAYYDSIVAATSAGIIVVEAAGNGSCNLNRAIYGSPFPAGRADSGAIIVGAGGTDGFGEPVRSRLGFSTHGSRVDVQGWGEGVATTGYGGLQGGPKNGLYTSTFGGTSSASPIVAAAAAIISSVAQGDGQLLTPTEVRDILRNSGTPQDTSSAGARSGRIGPLPDLSAALALVIDSCNGKAATLKGTPAGETINGTAGDDVIFADAGDDIVFGNGGNDTICLGDGNDRGDGGDGDDYIEGGKGADILLGRNGDDVLDGGPGGDKLRGHSGNDVLNGRRGNDTLSGGRNRDTLRGHNGRDILKGSGGGDILMGGPQPDTLNGGRGNDDLFGNAGNDTLIGGAGKDLLHGGGATDTGNGGPGKDVCIKVEIPTNC